MPKVFEPSPAEILHVCRAIQQAWSENEELRRRSAVDQVWNPLREELIVPIADEDSSGESLPRTGGQ